MNAKQPWDIENPEYKLHIRKIHDILTDEVEAFDTIIPNARKKLEFSFGTMHCYAPQQVHISTAKAPTQKVAVSNRGGELSAWSEGRLSHNKKIKANKSVRVPKVLSTKERNHSLQDHVVDRGYFIRIPSTMNARERMVEHILLQTDWRTSPSRDFLSTYVDDTENGWTNSQLSSHAAHRLIVFGMHST